MPNDVLSAFLAKVEEDEFSVTFATPLNDEGVYEAPDGTTFTGPDGSPLITRFTIPKLIWQNEGCPDKMMFAFSIKDFTDRLYDKTG